MDATELLRNLLKAQESLDVCTNDWDRSEKIRKWRKAMDQANRFLGIEKVEEIFDEIARACKQLIAVGYDSRKSRNDRIAHICKYLGKTHGDNWRENMIKIAGLAVIAVQAEDSN